MEGEAVDRHWILHHFSFLDDFAMPTARPSIAKSINIRGGATAGAEKDWATELVSVSNKEKACVTCWNQAAGSFLLAPKLMFVWRCMPFCVRRRRTGRSFMVTPTPATNKKSLSILLLIISSPRTSTLWSPFASASSPLSQHFLTFQSEAARDFGCNGS